MSQPKRVCILGSTGSIGENALRVIQDYPDRFQVVGLSAHASADRLAEQALQHHVRHVCLSHETVEWPSANGARLLRGGDGLVELVEACEPDVVVVATVGAAGLRPTLRAIELGATIALANKEVLVTAGELVMAAARRADVPILPIDSEHNAIFQCLAGRREGPDGAPSPLRRIILTASGGPFRGWSRSALQNVTRAQALNHPTWTMGQKITIDSATLMNKGFEVIETWHLFGEPLDSIEVVVHPESVIHGMIEYHDGSMLAQLGVTDMYLPIANVLAYPERLENTRFAPLDLATLGSLSFHAPDPDVFACLRLAYESARAGGTCPTVLNAANEVAVELFLREQIRFVEIPAVIEEALACHDCIAAPDIDTIAEVDRWARDWSRRRLSAAGA